MSQNQKGYVKAILVILGAVATLTTLGWTLPYDALSKEDARLTYETREAAQLKYETLRGEMNRNFDRLFGLLEGK